VADGGPGPDGLLSLPRHAGVRFAGGIENVDRRQATEGSCLRMLGQLFSFEWKWGIMECMETTYHARGRLLEIGAEEAQ
jgi:hypothetical protein